MKVLLFLLLAAALLPAQDTSQAPPDSVSADSSRAGYHIQKLNPDEYVKFFIGFAYDRENPEVLTLDIKSVSVSDSSISFSYIMNSHNSRTKGVGRIWPGKSRIYFDNLEDGRILLPRDGKLVFESLRKDSTHYWKLKEN
ncbi:MAG TPA: hypothetical protein ENJ10_07285 [Caldithrix abyssi]|uniref:Uncharacterized protein n=1 Tax=Caldithrix abyssi TaxID=187145 RepID=A0A7V1LM46_CALAY|nr:hypothetical protein [Caldithrix abyssi]